MILLQIIATILLSIVFASLFEWTLHRFVMHQPVKTPIGEFDYPFRAHAVVHHQTFRADHTYHLIDEHDKMTIPMKWWNGPFLIILSTAVFTPVVNWLMQVPIAWFWIGLTIAIYYGTYEYIHWCMHLPEARRIEKSTLFRRLNGHHILHHRYMHKNFNVVLPLADFLLGTLLTRSPIKFAQPKGPAVPDVQPKRLAPEMAGV